MRLRLPVTLLLLAFAIGCDVKTQAGSDGGGGGSSGGDATPEEGGTPGRDGDDASSGSDAGRGSSSGSTSDAGSSESGAEGPADIESDGETDTALTPGPYSCVPSTQYAASEPCPAGNQYFTFECDSRCFELAHLVPPEGGTTVLCAHGGSYDGGFLPYTDAGTIVLCCPVSSSQLGTSVPCEGPFM